MPSSEVSPAKKVAGVSIKAAAEAPKVGSKRLSAQKATPVETKKVAANKK